MSSVWTARRFASSSHHSRTKSVSRFALLMIIRLTIGCLLWLSPAGIASGAEILSGVSASQVVVTTPSSALSVATPSGPVDAKHVVLAAGCWSGGSSRTQSCSLSMLGTVPVRGQMIGPFPPQLPKRSSDMSSTRAAAIPFPVRQGSSLRAQPRKRRFQTSQLRLGASVELTWQQRVRRCPRSRICRSQAPGQG